MQRPMHVPKEGSQLTSQQCQQWQTLITVYQPYRVSTIISTLEKSWQLWNPMGGRGSLKKPQQVWGRRPGVAQCPGALHLRAPEGICLPVQTHSTLNQETVRNSLCP